MKLNFNSFGQFAQHLEQMVFKEYIAIQDGLEEASKLIEKDAKNEIGHLQPQIGGFGAWLELAESTKKDKERQGYVFNADYNPLLRTGELRDSISHQVEGLEAQIGSTSNVMVYQELGTDRIPARSVLGQAAYKNRKKIQAILGIAAVTGIMGGKLVYAAEFIDFAFKDIEH